MQLVDVGTGHLEGQRYGIAANYKIRLAIVGEREDMVGKSGAQGVVVNLLSGLIQVCHDTVAEPIPLVVHEGPIGVLLFYRVEAFFFYFFQYELK